MNKKKIPFLESRQKALYEKLIEKSDLLAKIYLGALHVLQQVDNPDRLALAAHNLRELMEKFPLFVDISIKPTGSLGDKVQALYQEWVKNGQAEETQEGICKNPRKISELNKKINAFFLWYKDNSSTRAQQIKKTLREIDPSKRAVPEPLEDLIAKFWGEMKNYFQKIAHHGKETDDNTFMEYLYQLEKFLLDKLKPPTFEDIDQIDEIIGAKG